MNLLSLLLGSMTTQSSVQSLEQKTDVSSALIRKLLPLAIPILIKALTQNASSQTGAMSLLGALTQHKSTKPMENQIAAADSKDGEKILGHILGSDYSGVIGNLAGQTGMTNDQVSSVLANIAPALLSGVSAANTTQAAKPAASGLDLGSLMGMFGGVSAQPVQEASSNEFNGASLLGLLSALSK
ncbi:MAG: DUF937 domain-containing protein [Lachnospiraceae bacterium]|nr:DUF937 domain-containing protein [Lachnospiraceae bacterium]